MTVVPVLATARLHFRPWCREDLDALHQLWTDPDVRRYLLDNQVISREQSGEFIDAAAASWTRTGLGMCSIAAQGSHEIIGFAGLHWLREDSREAELKYGFAPAQWGQGLATEASVAVLRDGFDRVQLDHIWASTDPPNTASIRVMERLGMTREECPFAVPGLVSYLMTEASYRAQHDTQVR